ncbi:LytR C-terminal domain-containing protein [Streptomyces mirabilis]|uniref:LytR C-terminal domain-containing protein n=1 Tax=Streptomyces mirabilis TaxID=68239 RepID=UPI00225852AC|nr:LytR C-terminal domain-containing protein [Streptomyces mirabilis]MCX4420299.1 LytR C-terminal domain-containing protein [Streptomyces mirabilis]
MTGTGFLLGCRRRALPSAQLPGTGAKGLALKVANLLRALGFQIAATGDAPAPVQQSTLTYPQDLSDQAQALADRLPGLTPTSAVQAAPGAVTFTVDPGLCTPSG